MAQALVVGFDLKPYTSTISDFNDVPANDPAYQYIEAATHDGVMSGYPGSGFHPSDKVKRGDAVTILVKTYGYPLYIPANPTFRDVPTSRPDYAAIETIASMGYRSDYLKHCADNSKDYCFRPEDYITRVELSKLIYDIVGP